MGEFNGTLTIRSISFGYGVTMEGQTDAHDLGHALAAAITYYISEATKANLQADPDELLEDALLGIQCGLKNNLKPSTKH